MAVSEGSETDLSTLVSSANYLIDSLSLSLSLSCSLYRSLLKKREHNETSVLQSLESLHYTTQ